MQANAIASTVLLSCLLITASVWDVKKRIIPDSISLLTAITGLICFSPVKLFGILAALPLLIAALCKEGSVGGGDIKLTAAAGIVTGLSTAFLGLILSLTASIVYYLIHQMVRKLQRVSVQPAQLTALPMAPFLCFGFLTESSYEAQVTYYTEKIQQNPNWKLAGIYADDGKSATNTKKREDFNSMIEDCMAGKIDLVLTKSVSRFARNTVDSLQNIRKLKEKNIGIVFEKEGVNTLEGTGELLITILSSQAQEESRNLSENTRWGLIRRFENGIVSVNHNKFLGYTKDKNGELVIVPEEAEIVRRIFRMYLEGASILKIAKALEADKIKTVTGNDNWNYGVIEKMLINEKYMGDVLQQKTYTVDFLTKKRVKNKGIVPQYYIEDNHEAIIPRDLFYRTQEEKARRASLHKPSVTKKEKEEKSKYSAKYALSELLVCTECGHPYRRQTWSKDGMKTAVWRCENRLQNGTKNCKHSPTLKEVPLHEAIMKALNSVVENKGEFIGAFRENVIRVIGTYSTKDITTEYDSKMEKLQHTLLILIEENAKQGVVDEEFDNRYQKIAEEIRELKIKKLKSVQEKSQAESYDQRVKALDQHLKRVSCEVREFDEDLIRRLLKRIQVINPYKIEIHFKSGIIMEQKRDYYED